MPDARTTDFDWSRYADATFAGLSILIPIPFVDDAFEGFFRGRIPWAVARSRGRRLPDDVRAVLGEEAGGGGCAALPARLVLGLFKRFSRKLLYYLTVKEASDRLSYYWYRAFLVDHMLAAGHLETAESSRVARQVMDELLATTSAALPLVAQQVAAQMRHVGPALRRARRGEESDEVVQTRNLLERRWNDVAEHLEALGARYDAAFARKQAT